MAPDKSTTFYYDTEFTEGFLPNRIFGIALPNWLSKRRHAIELISIGIVSSDGRTYSAISSEYNYNDANDWVKENVILPLYTSTVHGDQRNHFDVHNFHEYFGKTNKEIAQEIKEFVNPIITFPTLVTYYGDYDHVLLCSLFGTMMNLPLGFPMYSVDLKQKLDEKVNSLNWCYHENILPYHERMLQGKEELGRDRPATFEEKLKKVKSMRAYPKQENEHSSIADAKWNKALDEFIKSL